MRVIVTVDGKPEEHDLDLAMTGMTLKQSVKLEKIMGADRCRRLLGGDAGLAMMPTTIQALIYVKLADQFPDLKLDDFDFNLGEMVEPEAEVVELPMTLPDGSEETGSAGGDPTQGVG